MSLDLQEGASSLLVSIRPVVMEIQRRTMVDEPEPIAPNQKIWILGGAINIEHKGIKPDNLGREARIDFWRRDRVKRHGSRKEGEPEVWSLAAVDKIAYLWIRFVSTERGIQLRPYQL